MQERRIKPGQRFANQIVLKHVGVRHCHSLWEVVCIGCGARSRKTSNILKRLTDGCDCTKLLRSRKRKARKKAVAEHHCPYCQKPVRNLTRKTCRNKECIRLRKRDWIRRSSGIVEKVVQCSWCKADITTTRHGKHCFCSKRCARRWHQKQHPDYATHRKRARFYGVPYEFINTVEVLKRSGWHCGLCGCHTPSHLRGTISDQAPELGHIVPMSRGGGHLYSNVRCECHRCNGIKQHRLDSELVWLEPGQLAPLSMQIRAEVPPLPTRMPIVRTCDRCGKPRGLWQRYCDDCRKQQPVVIA